MEIVGAGHGGQVACGFIQSAGFCTLFRRPEGGSLLFGDQLGNAGRASGQDDICRILRGGVCDLLRCKGVSAQIQCLQLVIEKQRPDAVDPVGNPDGGFGTVKALEAPEGNMIVDIGGGTTEIAVISLGGIVSNKSIRIAGDDLTDDIQEYMRHQHNIRIV